jgi:hypothetical protein
MQHIMASNEHLARILKISLTARMDHLCLVIITTKEVTRESRGVIGDMSARLAAVNICINALCFGVGSDKIVLVYLA